MVVKRSAGRPAQRRRTRKAIVDAAMALLAKGTTPSVDEVAAAADVSRRTVYMHFPTFEQLLIDATVGALSQHHVDQAIDSGQKRGHVENDDENDVENDVESRVERMVRALHDVTPEVERLGRSLIRLTVHAPATMPGRDVPRRGYRRVEWIESALSPWRDKISPAQWRRLVAALAMVVGWEALIVQRDVCGLSAAEGEELSVWAARAFLEATLRDERTRRSRQRARRS
jgi:AcrR family transcriptional regulator